MARTAITPQAITVTGTAVTYEAANVAGNSVRMGPARAIHVKNGDGSGITVTMQTPGSVAGLAIAERTVTIPATSERFIRLDDVLRRDDDFAYVDYSAITSVTVAALDLV